MRKQYIAPQSSAIYITAASMLATSPYQYQYSETDGEQWSNKRDMGESIWSGLNDSEE